MKNFLIFVFFVIVLTSFFFYVYFYRIHSLLSPVIKHTHIPRPLLSYTFNNLKKDIFPKTQITLGRVVNEDADSISQLFFYKTPKSPNSNVLETVSGLLNVPKKPGNYPIIVMFRGFVPDNIYSSGVGTEPSASQLVKSGYITLAPDFLGFGESASPSADAFENRFQTYTTALSLFSSLPTLNDGLDASYSGQITADTTKIGVWGHSNGGHIALSTLAITGASYPTVLWAPVSKSFPYSILYYTDESDDQGKSLRLLLSKFEKIYNVYDFSPERYYNWIKAPILVDQGTADQEVPYWWTDSLVSDLKKYNIDINENIIPGADHNMLPMSTWNQAIISTINFYNKEFSKK